ncbi:hypothetical protein PhaeoP59_01925 [Phaeobacter inhibens]|nr:hypothetical protein PhaeoP59_01925 [Phaeobacter inhibens]
MVRVMLREKRSDLLHKERVMKSFLIGATHSMRDCKRH